jgi:DNA-binding transcriptional LysR family regulator
MGFSQSWDNLRYFLAVARTGTLSAAAEQLGTEPTTVARHIQALEEELASHLFHRSNSGYGLTEMGEQLLAGAEAIESAYASAKAAASSEGQMISGTERIGTPDAFAGLFLAPRVRVLTDRHPKLEIEIITTARLFSLSKREADRARARRHAMDALNERTARFSPGINTALDVISGAESGVLCGLHRHCGAFAVGAVEQQDLARHRGEHTQHTAR